MIAVALVTIAGACNASGEHASTPTSSTRLTTATTTPTATTVQTSGPRTVLSPIGLNVRAQPAKSAPVVGTAAQGTVLTVLGRTNKDSGGWLQVKGATVTGWITSDPSLSVPGEFRAYTSSPQFSALYPATWTASPAPPASVVFRSNTGADVIIAIPAANVSQLPQGGNGYGRSTSVQIVVCGVTSHLVTYQRAASAATPPSTTAAQPAYLVQARLTLDAQHALGFYASLTDLGPSLQVLRAFLASVTFPSPRCTG